MPLARLAEFTWSRSPLAHSRALASQTVNKILIGNKCDLESMRQVSRQQGEQLAREYGMKFLETSARDSTNVQEAFITLATDVVDRLVRDGNPEQSNQMAVQVNTDRSTKGGCC